MNFDYKIDHKSKNEIAKIGKIDFSIVSGHCASFMQIEPPLKIFFLYEEFYGYCRKKLFFHLKIMKKIDHNQENENWKYRKIDFSFNSALCASIIKMGVELRGEGGLHTLRWEKFKNTFK